MAKSLCHVERNLRFLEHMPRVSVTNIRDFYGAKHNKRRRGRGDKTAGRGMKGQGQYSAKPRIGFEGGQSPFYLAVPKHGIQGARSQNKLNLATVSLNKIQWFIDAKRIDPHQPITLPLLYQTRLLEGVPRDGVRLLAEGHTWFQGTIDIEVTRAGQEAITAVERNGGRVRCVWHDQVMLRYLLRSKPSKKYSVVPPTLKRPTGDLLLYYGNPLNRGYLADPEEVERLREENVKLGRICDELKELKVTEVD